MTEAPGFPGVELGGLHEGQLAQFAHRLARSLCVPLVIFLEGDLGAGKTTLCRALIQSLGHAGRVKSPTYGLLEHYALAELDVLHLDLYRIGDPGELEFLAIQDALDERTLLLVEWPERGQGVLPEADLVIRLEHANDARFVYLKPRTERGNAVCRAATDKASS
jgi:tRNA threonylcarbamoyladenosine biosynthesis protein TsaE